ncbi:MAG: hypothetical protein ACRDRX_20470 [Pseudonocardiaceae bacterium]
MTYLAASTVQIEAWVSIGSETEICYEVTLADDDVEFTIGGPDGLKLTMREAALRRCVATFTAALDTLTTGHPAQPAAASGDQIPCEGSTPISR